MSQCIPTIADVTATTAHQINQGVVDSVRSIIYSPIMMEANKALINRWFEEVWNQGRESTIDELFAATGVVHGLGDTETDVAGPAQLKVFVHNFRGAIPDVHMTVEDAVAEGDKVSVRNRVEGTHKGAGLGVAPSGRRISIAGIIIARIRDGQIVEGWNSWDQLGFLRQIGALPVAEGPDRFVAAQS
jgi:steroid delta-isomerase-like uncharacterized protein